MKTVALWKIQLSVEEKVDSIHKRKIVPARSKIKNFLSFNSEDEVIRARANGRLANTYQQVESLETSLILSSNDHITFLILRYIHNYNGHSELDHFGCLVQQSFLVISLHGTIRTKINRCFHCRQKNAVAMQPQMAPSTDLRIPNTEHLIFKHEGVNFVGPFAKTTSANLYQKRYFCVFTNLNKRAVHLEPVYQLSTDSIIQPILGFTARRGNPRLIVSDNGKFLLALLAKLSQK